MAKLSKGLSEVDRKVENLRKTFEKTTTEAAKMKVELDKANETIAAADNLVGKLGRVSAMEWAGWCSTVFWCFQNEFNNPCTGLMARFGYQIQWLHCIIQNLSTCTESDSDSNPNSQLHEWNQNRNPDL